VSLSKGVIGAISALVGALVSAGILIPFESHVTRKAEQVVVSTEAVAVAAATTLAGVIQVQKPPVYPDPNPDPDPSPVPTPVPTPEPVIPDGNIGCQFPPIYDKWWLRSTDQFAYLAGMVEDANYRTNVMFNWEGQFKHEIEAVSSVGVVLGSLSFDTYLLEPCTPDNVTYHDGVCSGMFQLNRFISHIDQNYTGAYSIRVKPVSGAGRIFFYATMIDNRSGDCTTFTQFRRTKNNNMWAESGLYYQGSFDAETEDI